MTVDEWLAELEAALKPSAGVGVTAREIVAATGRPGKWVADRLWLLSEAGRLGVGSKAVPDITGRVRRVPSYWLKRAE